MVDMNALTVTDLGVAVAVVVYLGNNITKWVKPKLNGTASSEAAFQAEVRQMHGMHLDELRAIRQLNERTVTAMERFNVLLENRPCIVKSR